MESHSKNHKEGSASYNCTEPLFSPHPTQSVLFIHSFCASLTLSLLLPAECHLQSLTGNKQRAETTNDTKKSILSGVYMTAGFKSLYSLFLKVFPNHKRNFLKLVVIKDFIVYRLYSVSPWEVTSQLSLKLNGLKSREVSAERAVMKRWWWWCFRSLSSSRIRWPTKNCLFCFVYCPLKLQMKVHFPPSPLCRCIFICSIETLRRHLQEYSIN